MAQRTAHTSLTIRNLPLGVKQRLRVRAARHGRSLEAEAREILQSAAAGGDEGEGEHLFDKIQRLFAPLGGVELELPARRPGRPLPNFDAKA